MKIINDSNIYIAQSRLGIKLFNMNVNIQFKSSSYQTDVKWVVKINLTEHTK